MVKHSAWEYNKGAIGKNGSLPSNILLADVSCKRFTV